MATLDALAADDEWVLLGGIPEVAVALLSMLPTRLRTHARRPAGLDVHATDARIAEVVETVVTEASRQRDADRVDELFDQLGSSGQGMLGVEGVREALREHAVRRLYLTGTTLGYHPLEAEALVRAAFEEGAEIEYLSGSAATRLDEQGGGVGALLRFVPARAQAPLPSIPPAPAPAKP
jgi:hypothetical protein